jgi:RNA polymerase sigma-70 factor, ECF subfamily
VTTRQDEFEELALPHLRSLLRVARRLSPDSAAAEDLVQETYLLAWRGFGRFRPGTNMRAWLFRILMNAFYGQGRKQRTSPVVVPLPSTEDEGITAVQTGSTFQTEAGALESAELSRAFEELAADHRAVLLLGVVEGFTCEEMAEILSIPMGTVMSRLSRARQALRARLAPSAMYARKGDV